MARHILTTRTAQYGRIEQFAKTGKAFPSHTECGSLYPKGACQPVIGK
jgi:hypothetical protein